MKKTMSWIFLNVFFLQGLEKIKYSDFFDFFLINFKITISLSYLIISFYIIITRNWLKFLMDEKNMLFPKVRFMISTLIFSTGLSISPSYFCCIINYKYWIDDTDWRLIILIISNCKIRNTTSCKNNFFNLLDASRFKRKP